MIVEGSVVYVEIEGGVWGIEGDDGVKYRPVGGLPQTLKTPGKRVRATLEASNEMSMIMWGRAVELRSSEEL